MHQDSKYLTIKDKEDTDLQRKQDSQPGKKQPVYFMTFICTPQLLDNPTNKKQSFQRDLWSNKNIKSIKQMSYYIQISINHRKKQDQVIEGRPDNIKQLTQQITISDDLYQSQLKSIKNNFVVDYPLLKKKMEGRPKSSSEQEFDQWIKTMKGRNFVGWYLPLRQQGPKLRKLAISKETLKLLGYEPQQFHFQFEKYLDLAIGLINGSAYKEAFIAYLSTFRKFMSMQIRGDMTLQECTTESERIFANQMKGKNQMSVKVEMKWSMPNIYTVCYQILRVLQQSQFKDHQMNEYKKSLACKVQKKTYHSLSRITRLPKDMNPENRNKICSYQIIRQPIYVVQPKDKEKLSQKDQRQIIKQST